MSILKGDVIFARAGEPVLITVKDKATGNVEYDRDLGNVQAATGEGIKNGLREETKQAFRTILSEVRDDDVKREIDNLHTRIESLRKENADPRLMRYLKGELQFRMNKERYEPAKYQVDPMTLTSS